jgi:septum site-determining protein MinC
MLTAALFRPQRPPRPSADDPARAVAFDLKGTMAPLTVLRLRSTDLPLIERQLRVKIAQLPHLFLDAPVLLDMGALPADEELALGDLVGVLRGCKLVPVAASNVPEAMRARALEAGLGLMQATPAPRARGERLPEATVEAGAQPAPTAAPSPSPSPYGGPVVITQPVRSGQVVHAHDNDLVVLAPVNPGAQVIADGHLHVYAPLRGRAVAGAQGLLGARIFCQKLEAELVAISGAYMMAEEMPPERRGKPAQVYLEGGECRIAPL